MKIKTKNHLSLALFLLSTLLMFAAYPNVEAQKKTDSEILITIERKACFGSCPVYSAQIYSNGTVIYIGKDNVKIIGEKRHKISEGKVKKLIKAFEQTKYFSLKDKYETDENGMRITDLPTTITSISLNGKQKKIVNYYGAPKKLKELENFIDRTSGLSEYIGSI